MSDIETTTSTAESHAETVARVMSSVARRIDSGEDAHEALREVLADDGLALTDLPEVGMWFAMSQMGTSFAANSADVTPVVDLTTTIEDADAVEIDLRTPPAGAGVEVVEAAEVVPDTIELIAPAPARPDVAPPAEDAAARRRRANRLGTFLRAALDDRRTRDAIRDGLGTQSVGAPSVPPAAPTPAAPDAPTPAEPTPDAEVTPAPVPERWPELAASLRQLLTDLPPIALPDPTRRGTSLPQPYWSPAVARALRTGASIRSALAATDATPVDRALRALRRLDEPGTSTPDPYWPRHVVRAGAVPVGRAVPRSADRLERDLARRFASVRLAGQADIDADRVEVGIALARALRRDRRIDLPERAPATLIAGLVIDGVDPTGGHGMSPLVEDRLHEIGDEAIANALDRLGLDDLSGSPGGRHRRPLDLHLALSGDLDAIVSDVAEALDAGARNAREVARIWALSTAARERLGDAPFDLFVWTPAGEAALAEILDVLERSSPGTEAPTRPRWTSATRSGRRVLSARALASVLDATRRLDPTIPTARPDIRLGRDGEGPVVVLPPGSGRWHLNGELLGYGSPGDEKPVLLAPPRRHGWAITSRASGGRSVADLSIRSASTTDTVLLFDELGRLHPSSLPVSGARVTVIAPAGSTVDPPADEAVTRVALDGKWAGFERIDVEPVTGRNRWRVVTPSRARTEIAVDRSVGASIAVQRLEGIDDRRRKPVVAPTARIGLDGHLHPEAEVGVTVRAGGTVRRRRLSDLTDGAPPGSRLLSLADVVGGTAEVVVERDDHDPTSAEFVVAPATVSDDGARLDLAAGWCSAPPVVLLDTDAAPQRIELRQGDRRLRLRARLAATGPDDPRERVWWDDPVAAAAIDDWSTDRAAERWERWTGWTPPAGPGLAEGVDALERLIAPLEGSLVASGSASTGRASAGSPVRHRFAVLRREEWDRVTSIDAEGLAAWSRRFGRAARQLRSRDGASRNLEPIWRHGRGASGVLVDLVTVAVIAAGDGPKSIAAARALAEATSIAPDAVIASSVFGTAYARLQRTHPPTRFHHLR